MTPDEVVLQLKRNGTFDDLRKRLLYEFQSGDKGETFIEKLKSFMEDMVAKNPSLLEKESSSFHDYITTELERAGVYDTIRQEALESLKGNYYQARMNDEIKAVTEKADASNNNNN